MLEPSIATILLTIAAVANVRRTSHSHVLFVTQPLELDSGSQHFALQQAVAARVSYGYGIVNICGDIIEKYSFFTGVVTSLQPNYPGNYPHNLQRTEMIQVEKGLVISLQFTSFDIENGDYPYCSIAHLTITDGDGSTLMEKSCGRNGFNVVVGGEFMESNRPPVIKSNSNVVKLLFHTDGMNSGKTGWSASWSAGECQQQKLL